MSTKTLSIARKFLEDHAQMDELMERYRKYKEIDIEQAARYFSDFVRLLKHHMSVEDEIVFPVFDSRCQKPMAGLTETLRAQHKHIITHLAAIQSKLLRNDMNTEVEEVSLMRALTEHEKDEDSGLYPVLDQILTEGEQRMIFWNIERAFKV